MVTNEGTIVFKCFEGGNARGYNLALISRFSLMIEIFQISFVIKIIKM